MLQQHIELFDTTLRDGTQGEYVTLTAEDKLRIAQRLDQFGIRIIEGGWPGSNPKDHEFFTRAKDLPWQNARLCAFGSTRRSGLLPENDPNLAAMLAADTPVVSLFGKSWTLHAQVALGVTLEENLGLISSSVAYLKAHGRHVVYDAEHFFDGYKADRLYALETLRAAADGGADVLTLCDTNGGTMPHEVYDIVKDVCSQFETAIGIHVHNDGGCATANTLTAVRAGARHVQGTINGIGERCGNADLCSVIPGLQLKLGYRCVSDEALESLTHLSQFVYEVANLSPVDRSPYVGRSAFAHKGGVHVSAVMKQANTYEHIDPEQVGNRRRVLVSDLAGQSNVRYKADELGIEVGDKQEARKIADRIKELEHLGYEFEGAEASFELLIRTMRGEQAQFFSLERLRVRTEMEQDGVEHSEASLVLRVDGSRELVAAEGAGPVDSLSTALRKGLVGFYPDLESVRLTDYKVRVLNPGAGTAAMVRVLVQHSDGERSWNTVGVSENILEASWQALADGIRFHLLRTCTEKQDAAHFPASGGKPRAKTSVAVPAA
jgi:2-isopropylmalate synthase